MLALLALLPVLALAAPAPQLGKRYSGVKIQANRDGKCLSVSGNQHATFTDGSGVYSVDCAVATTWDINPGSGSVLAHNVPQFALDAGTNPGNNGALKIWTSYPGLSQQTWYLTDDKRIAITGGNQCLDEGDNGIQTYQCTPGNTNQIFNIIQSGGGSGIPSASSSVSPTTTSSPVPSASSTSKYPSDNGETYPDPADGSKRLHPAGRNSLCLGAINGYPGEGTPLQIIYCHPNDVSLSFVELFYLPAVGTTGPIKLRSNTDLCIDAGSNPSDGGEVKLWKCYDGLAQQTWTYDSQNLALQTANNQCLDYDPTGSQVPQKPYGYYPKVQTWTCSNNDHQKWTTLLA